MIKIGINGFGRIGRTTFRAALERYDNQVQVVAVNTSGSMKIEGWAHLLKYDSVYGKFFQDIEIMPGEKGEIGRLVINKQIYPFLAVKEPAKIPWDEYKVDVVLESTGCFRTNVDCQDHLKAGAKKVIISAPAKDETPTFIVGVNNDKYKGEKIVSNASCTTNCIAPIAKIMMENFKVVRASMTTIHSYTADQELVDGSHKDLRRARAAAINIVPTSTGAADALVKVLPKYEGKFGGSAIRVPVACGSLADFTFILDQTVRDKKIRDVFEQASTGDYRGIVEVTNEPLVSSDIIKTCASTIVDLSLVEVTGGNLVKVVAWYDNEWGYSCRMIELAGQIGNYD
jgi:glyceraldehyde 3-phosphate dehydrogenase